MLYNAKLYIWALFHKVFLWEISFIFMGIIGDNYLNIWANFQALWWGFHLLHIGGIFVMDFFAFFDLSLIIANRNIYVYQQFV